MKDANIWYILLPKKHTYVGPYSDIEILKFLYSHKIKLTYYAWSPKCKHSKWRMLIEYPVFQRALKNSKWLFSLSESDYLQLYKTINGLESEQQTRDSWYEAYIKNGKRPITKEFTKTDIELISVPRRSKRYNLNQVLYMQVKEGPITEAQSFIVSQNGLYLNVKDRELFKVGKRIHLSTMDYTNQQTIHLNGLITSENENSKGKGLGIRFIKVSRIQKDLLTNWINTLSA